MSKPKYYIKENSFFARIAAKKLRAQSVAMVLGKTIHLHGCTKEHFLEDERWVKHELCHIKQYEENGTILFLIKYLWESLKKGYYNNKYEVEAREAEDC
jgi:Domain of unknown function (DUF4157)